MPAAAAEDEILRSRSSTSEFRLSRKKPSEMRKRIFRPGISLELRIKDSTVVSVLVVMKGVFSYDPCRSMGSALGGVGHTLPYLIPDIHIANAIAVVVVLIDP